MKQKHNFRKTSLQGLFDIFYIWREEMRNVIHDQGVFIFFILVPLGYPLLYSFIYTNEVVRDVSVVVVDDAHTQQSREFIHKVDASPDVCVSAYSNDMTDAQLALREHETHGIIHIPSDFSKDIMNTKQAHIAIYCDMGSLFYYKAILSACTEVSLDMNKKIKIERGGGGSTKLEEINAEPVTYENISMFNPTNGFAAFLIPAVLMLILQQTLVLGVGMSAGTACETNRFKDLVPINRHYNGTLRIVLGKALCYFMTYVVAACWVLVAVPRIFKLNQLANPWTLLAFIIPFLCACTFFAMAVSVVVRNREKSIILFAFISVPLLFLSGISWPGSSIPTFWKVFSYIFPSTFGINGFVRINNMAATLHNVRIEYHALWLQCGIYFILTCFVYRWQIMTSRKHAIEQYKKRKEAKQKTIEKPIIFTTISKDVNSKIIK